MKRILVPISFSSLSEDALFQAKLIADHYHASITLLHCYSPLEYNRRFDFSNDIYKNEVEKMLLKFYRDHITEPSQTVVKCIAHEGSISNIIHNISSQYDLIVLKRNAEPRAHSVVPLSQKILSIISKSSCPVFISPLNGTPLQINAIKSVWHIKRKEVESRLVAISMRRLGLKEDILKVKSLEQKVFLSPLWKRIMSSKKPIDSSSLATTNQLLEQEQIDLIYIVYYNPKLFDAFLEANAIKTISDLDIPLMIINQALNQ
jgi:nucleotide-binding universal stress UspA family protein